MTKLVIGLRKIVFNATMRDARKAKGLTLQALALLVYERAITEIGVRSRQGAYSQRLGHYERMISVPPPDVAQEIADALEVPIDDIFPEVLRKMPRARVQEERLAASEMQLPEGGGDVADALALLSARERQIVETRYGLIDGRAKTLAVVGDNVGLSGARIQQHMDRSLEKMRSLLRGRQIAQSDLEEHQLEEERSSTSKLWDHAVDWRDCNRSTCTVCAAQRESLFVVTIVARTGIIKCDGPATCRHDKDCLPIWIRCKSCNAQTEYDYSMRGQCLLCATEAGSDRPRSSSPEGDEFIE